MMKSFAGMFAVGCAALVLSACDSMLTRPSLYSTVEVNATRRNGDPIPGAQLVLYTGSRPMGYGATDSSGRFVFTRVPPGSYAVRAYALPPEYEFAENLLGGAPTNLVEGLSIKSDTGIVIPMHFVKRGPGTVVAVIQDAAGVPLSGLSVILYNAKATLDSVKTDTRGRATFANVPFGNYGVTVTRPFLYRNFRTFGDSIASSRDGLLVEAGLESQATISIARCAGTLRIAARDENGAPVPGATAAAFAFIGSLGVVSTDASGRAEITAPCGIAMGVQITPPVGFTSTQTQFTSVIDGLQLKTDNQSLDVVFRLEHKR